MASQNLNVSTANSGQGDKLRVAFVAVKQMFHDIYGIAESYEDALDISGETFHVSTTQIEDDAVTYDKLEDRYTEKLDIATTSGTINLDASSYAIFELTGALGSVTLNVQGMKKGQVIDILLTGTLTSAVIELTDDFATSAINKVGSTSLDTSKSNIIQILCVDDNDSDAILNYAIATYESDTNPD